MQVCFMCMFKWFLVDEAILWLVVGRLDCVMLLLIVIVWLACHDWLVMHISVSGLVRVRGRYVVLNVVMNFMTDDWVHFMVNNRMDIVINDWV